MSRWCGSTTMNHRRRIVLEVLDWASIDPANEQQTITTCQRLIGKTGRGRARWHDNKDWEHVLNVYRRNNNEPENP